MVITSLRHQDDEPSAEPPASVPADAPATILDALAQQAIWRTYRPAFTIADSGSRTLAITYGELYSRALAVAAGLRNRGLGQGDRVLICLPTDLEMLLAVYGVLLAGGVCVPVYPPLRTHNLQRWRKQMASIAWITQPCGAIVSPLVHLPMTAVLEEHPQRTFTALPDQLEAEGADGPATIFDDDLAFIQFTSGTTQQPRGVSISHAALMANIRAMTTALELSAADVSVSWLPPYHDMGLVGHIFVPVQSGVHQHLISPITFLEQPRRWLSLISETRATQTTAPNFAYAMCVRRIPPAERAGLDLSSLRWVLNGAESVRAETLQQFSDAFAPVGFSPAAFRPVYGLAEATLAVTFSSPGGPQFDWVSRQDLIAHQQARPVLPTETDGQCFVSVGHPLPGHQLRLVDAQGADCAERQVGEILVQGPSVMSGYFNDPQSSLSAMPDGWLHTGDLGYQADGKLYVTGRRKELIIKRGRNYLPQDFEEACLDFPQLRPGRAVAFGVANHKTGTEDIVLLAEVSEGKLTSSTSLALNVAHSIATRTGLRPDKVLLLPAGVLPKTSSGKLQRTAAKAAYEAGTLTKTPRRISDLALVTVTARSFAKLAHLRLKKLLGWH